MYASTIIAKQTPKSTQDQSPPKSTQDQSPPKALTRFIPKPPTVVSTYDPTQLRDELDSGDAFSLTTAVERDAAGTPTFAVFNFGGSATVRVPTAEGTLLGKTVVAAVSAAVGIAMETLAKSYSFTYGILPLLDETDLSCDKRADGTVKPVNSRTIRVTPLPKCRACGFPVDGKAITSNHGLDGEIVAVHRKENCYRRFTFMAGKATFQATPADGKERIELTELTEKTCLYRLVDCNFVPITDDASSGSDRMTLDGDGAPIAKAGKAAPKKKHAPRANKPTPDDASSCSAATEGDAPVAKGAGPAATKTKRFTETHKPLTVYTHEQVRQAHNGPVAADTAEKRRARYLAQLNTGKPRDVYAVTVPFGRDGCNVTSATFSAGGPTGYVRPMELSRFQTGDGDRMGVCGATAVAAFAACLRVSMNDVNTNFTITYGGFLKLTDETDIAQNPGTQVGKGLIESRTLVIRPLPVCIVCGDAGGDMLHAPTGVFGTQINAHSKCTAAPGQFIACGATFTLAATKKQLHVAEPAGLTVIKDGNHVLRVPQATAAAPVTPSLAGVVIKQEKTQGNVGPPVLRLDMDEEANGPDADEAASMCSSSSSKRSLEVDAEAGSKAETVTKKMRVEVVQPTASESPLDMALAGLNQELQHPAPCRFRLAAIFGKYATSHAMALTDLKQELQRATLCQLGLAVVFGKYITG
jgi:hypothetical protein